MRFIWRHLIEPFVQQVYDMEDMLREISAGALGAGSWAAVMVVALIAGATAGRHASWPIWASAAAMGACTCALVVAEVVDDRGVAASVRALFVLAAFAGTGAMAAAIAAYYAWLVARSAKAPS